MLPIHQVCTGETGAAEWFIQPDAEVMQRHLRRQAGLNASEGMGTLAREADGLMHLVVDRLDDLAHPGQPPSRTFGPGMPALPLRRANYLGPIVVPPARMSSLSLEAVIADIRAQRGLPDAWAAGVRRPTQRKEGLGQGLILGTGRAKAKAGNHPSRMDRHEQVEAFVPAEAVAPADIGPARQPAGAPALGISRRHRRAIQGFIEPVAARQEVHQVQEARDTGPVVTAQPAIELRPLGQGRKGGAQVLLGVAVERPFASEAGPLPKEGQRDHLAAAERGPRTWVDLRW